MKVNKKFLEAVSKDEALKAELEQAALAALGEFLKSKGLEAEAGKITEAATEKVAEAHGFRADDMEEISDDELKSVVGGGGCGCWLGGGGAGGKISCACFLGGYGGDWTKEEGNTKFRCVCPYAGAGWD